MPTPTFPDAPPAPPDAPEGLDAESMALAFLLIAREIDKGSSGANDDIVSMSLIRRWVRLARAGMPGVLAFDAQRAGLI
jgi:hypothetical protein